jgi:hypothetical protein
MPVLTEGGLGQGHHAYLRERAGRTASAAVGGGRHGLAEAADEIAQQQLAHGRLPARRGPAVVSALALLRGRSTGR